jgi:hypothetical protein
VYLLWHSYETDGDADEHSFLLGVYSTQMRAEARIGAARLLPGFRRYPDSFVVDEYVIDKDQWTEGFRTLHAGEWVPDPDA